jgi:hypothetical protein
MKGLTIALIVAASVLIGILLVSSSNLASTVSAAPPSAAGGKDCISLGIAAGPTADPHTQRQCTGNPHLAPGNTPTGNPHNNPPPF